MVKILDKDRMNLPHGYAALPAEICYVCRHVLHDPLFLCSCECRLPIHANCYNGLVLSNRECPICRKTFRFSSNSSVISVPELVVERPLSHTECVPSCSTRWMVYSLLCVVIGVGALFLFFYYIKQ
jgi:hypothetical protein